MASSQRPAVVIVGASARAMAESATRAGWAVHAADLFGDVDLVRVAVAVRRVDPYPASIVDAASSFPPAPWCYTGALENHPELIDAISASRPLAGNPASAVRRVRDPAILEETLRAFGVQFPETKSTPAGLATDGSFLVKPLASAGGRGISRWTESLAHSHRGAAPVAPARAWQRFVEGDCLAACYLTQAGRATLLGMSRQLIGEPWCHARPFAYCGSLALAGEELADSTRERLASLGAALAEGFRLVGLVGVDLVIDAGGGVTPIEVNPRPTASMELIERAGDASIAGLHLDACGFASPRPAPSRSDAQTRWSKGVLFAPHDVAIDVRLLDSLHARTEAWIYDDGRPAIADIPRPGQTIRAGSPVITVFARGESADDCRQRLMDRMRTIQQILFDCLFDARS